MSIEDVPPILPSPLELPHSGGKVWFYDPESLRGKEYKRLRAAAMTESATKVYETAAALLVERWEVPGLPNLPLPGTDEGLDGQVTDLLHWRDLKALEDALAPAILLLRGVPVAGPPILPSAG